MRKLILLAFFGLVNLTSFISGDSYGITTVYKFNTVEEADQNGDVTITYLNICTVAIYPQSNAVGLPYYNLQDKDQVQYPPGNPRIKFSMNEVSEWTDWSESRDISESDIFQLFENEHVLLENLAEDSPPDEQFTIFDADRLAKYITRQNAYLYVDVPVMYAKDFKIYLGKTEVEYILIDIHLENNMVSFCLSGTNCEEYVYESSSQSQISFYINLQGYVRMYDMIARKEFHYGLSENFRVNHFYIERDIRFDQKLTYKIVQVPDGFSLGDISDGATMTSPWIGNMDNNSAVFIEYERESYGNVSVHLQDKVTNSLIRLDSEEQNVMQIDALERVLTKVNIRYPKNWTQEKQIQIKGDKILLIRNIWEGGNQEMYIIHDTKECVKDDITDIYDVALEKPRHYREITLCLNGGFPDQYQETCVCPPGFTGDACEIACGSNSYGNTCSNLCSDADTECKGVVLCTPSYGCSCAPGYHGNHCSQECDEGTYGVDCKQSCGQCEGGCDRYTGECRGECDTPYLVWPSCKEQHIYWTGLPVVTDSGFKSVKLDLNFGTDIIVKSSETIKFYRVQFKEDTQTLWTNSSLTLFSPMSTEYEVINLKPGKKYYFRVLLLDATLRESDPRLSNISEGLTKCIVSNMKTNLNVTQVTKDSITLNWREESLEENQCPTLSYVLNIDELVGSRTIIHIKTNSFVVKHLGPGKTYNIKLKKNTIHGESSIDSNVTVSTLAGLKSMKIQGVTLSRMNASQFDVQWFRNRQYNTYFIKYKVKRFLSCSYDESTLSPWQVVTTTLTNHTLSLKPYALYQVFVTGDETQSNSKHQKTVVTDGELPDISPNILKEKFKITNESALIYWKDPPTSCYHMNGFFKNYVIQLLDYENKLLKTYETQQREIEMTGLLPRTSYTVRIRYENHLGSNAQIYEQESFTTKAASSIEDLTAYKASANMIGIRWKIPDTNTTITGINVAVQNHVFNKIILVNITNVTFIQCKAWPSYVCYEITQLKQNTKYNVSVEIFSEEYPKRSEKWIQVITRESIPLPVTDVKAVNVYQSNDVNISWRIPFLLNGILKEFSIRVEHLSSFDESLCCERPSNFNLMVTAEKEMYYLLLPDLLRASSYEVTIRALTERRMGQETGTIIHTPPSIPFFRIEPRVRINNTEIAWKNKEIMNESTAVDALISDVLIIVLSESDDGTKHDTNTSERYRIELSEYLKSNNWWLAHVCPADEEDCTVDIGNEKEMNSAYGEVKNKPLADGHKYTIAVAQVNLYMSARSYTVIKSAWFQMKENVPISSDIETSTMPE